MYITRVFLSMTSSFSSVLFSFRLLIMIIQSNSFLVSSVHYSPIGMPVPLSFQLVRMQQMLSHFFSAFSHPFREGVTVTTELAHFRSFPFASLYLGYLTFIHFLRTQNVRFSEFPSMSLQQGHQDGLLRMTRVEKLVLERFSKDKNR